MAPGLMVKKIFKIEIVLPQTRRNLLARITAEDMRTVMGKTMAKLKTDLKGMEVSCTNIKNHLKYFPVPELETWRIDYLEELLDSKNLVIENMNADDITAMIGLLCTS